MHLLAKRTLLYILIFQLSGLPALAARSRTPSQFDQIEEIANQTLDIENALKEISNQINYRGMVSLGENNHRDAVEKLRKLENDVAAWKGKLESFLALPNTGLTSDQTVASANYKTLLILEYFSNILSRIIRIHAGMPTSFSSGNEKSLSVLHIPYKALKQIVGIDTDLSLDESKIVFQKLPVKKSLIKLDPRVLKGMDLSNDEPVELRINNDAVRSLIASAKATDSNEKSYFILAKYLAANMLYTRWSDINLIRKKPQERAPEIPHKLRDELSPLADFDLVIQSEKELNDERKFLQALALSAPEDLPFVTDAFIRGLAVHFPWQKDFSKMKELLQASEKVLLDFALVNTLEGYALPLHGRDPKQLKPVLKKAFTHAKFFTILDTLKTIDVPKEIAGDPKKLVALQEQLESFYLQSVESYEKKISDQRLSQWLDEASKKDMSAANATLRSRYIRQLVRESFNIAQSPYPNELELNPRVDLGILKKALLTDVLNLEVQKSAQKVFELVVAMPSYEYSKKAFRAAIKKLADDAKTTSEPKVLKALEKDIRDLKTLGDWYGFSVKSNSPFAPKLSELPISSIQRKNYLETLSKESESYSILNVKVGKAKTPLYQILSKCDRICTESQAEEWVEEATDTLTENIGKGLHELADAKEPMDLISLLAHSKLLKETIDKDFPALRKAQESLMQKMADRIEGRGTFEQYNEIYTLPMQWMLPFFIFPVLSMPFRQSMPWIMSANRIHLALQPYVAGYMWTSIPLIFADFGMKGFTWNQERERFNQMETFFYTSATEKSFFDYLDMMTAQSKVEESLSHLRSAFTFQTALMGAPLFAGIARRIGAKLLDTWRASKMANIGMGPNHYSWNRKEIVQSAASRRAEIEESQLTADKKAIELEAINQSESSLLKLVDRQEARAELIRKDFARQIQLLGLSAKDNPLNYEVLDQAIRKLRYQFEMGQVSIHDWTAALEARFEIVNFMKSEWGVSLNRGQISAKSLVRQTLLQQVYGFQVQSKDYYAILDVRETASQAEIKKAYFGLREKNPSQDLNDAYQILGRPDQRTAYDELRRSFLWWSPL